MVDHTFIFHPAVEHISKLIQSGELGSLLYFDSIRVNLGGFQAKTNVLWDLAPHDLSIVDLWHGGQTPTHVAAFGVKHFDDGVENISYLHLHYANKFIAHLHLNWTAPTKIRTVTVCGSKKMAIFDDNNPIEKVKIYDRSLSVNYVSPDELRVNYRSGDILAPALPGKEALAGVIEDFISIGKNG